MKSTCIQHPAKDDFFRASRWQWAFCGGNHCAAILMSLFEYWHSIRLEQSRKSAQANVVAEMGGDEGKQDTSLLQYHTQEELRDYFFGLFSVDKIREAINLLVEKGVVSRHKNPNSRYWFDRTTYYQFHPEVCQEFLTTYNPQPTEIPQNGNVAVPMPKNRYSRTDKSAQDAEKSVFDAEKSVFDAEKSVLYTNESNTNESNTNESNTNESSAKEECFFEEKSKKRISSKNSPGFLRFKKIHPHGNRDTTKAREIWERKKLENIAEEICQAVTDQVTWEEFRHGFKYFNRMPSWLNQEKWRDERPSQRQLQSKPPSVTQITLDMLKEHEAIDITNMSGDKNDNSSGNDQDLFSTFSVLPRME